MFWRRAQLVGCTRLEDHINGGRVLYCIYIIRGYLEFIKPPHYAEWLTGGKPSYKWNNALNVWVATCLLLASKGWARPVHLAVTDFKYGTG